MDDVACFVEVLALIRGNGNVLTLASIVPAEKLEGWSAGDDAGSLIVQQGDCIAL